MKFMGREKSTGINIADWLQTIAAAMEVVVRRMKRMTDSLKIVCIGRRRLRQAHLVTDALDDKQHDDEIFKGSYGRQLITRKLKDKDIAQQGDTEHRNLAFIDALNVGIPLFNCNLGCFNKCLSILKLGFSERQTHDLRLDDCFAAPLGF